MNEIERMMLVFYKGEIRDTVFYSKLSNIERDAGLKENLKKLSDIEKYHSEFWASLLKKHGIDYSRYKVNMFYINILLFLRFIFGLSLTLKILERGETKAINAYFDFLEKSVVDENEKNMLRKIILDEIDHEDFFEKENSRFQERMERIRDSIYGMSDGLVEVLGAIAGLEPVILTPIFVAIGGLVVGISGSLSMTIGAYLAVKAQKDYSDAKIDLERKKNILQKKSENIQEEEFRNPLRSAFETGIFYIIGAMFPIMPFFFLGGIFALIISIILVVLAQAVTNTIVAIISGTSIVKSVTRTVILTLSASAITYMIGNFVHSVLGIVI